MGDIPKTAGHLLPGSNGKLMQFQPVLSIMFI
jgi:hypothetical protein